MASAETVIEDIPYQRYICMYLLFQWYINVLSLIHLNCQIALFHNMDCFSYFLHACTKYFCVQHQITLRFGVLWIHESSLTDLMTRVAGQTCSHEWKCGIMVIILWYFLNVSSDTYIYIQRYLITRNPFIWIKVSLSNVACDMVRCL